MKFGFELIQNAAVPPNEVWLTTDGRVIHKIVNLTLNDNLGSFLERAAKILERYADPDKGGSHGHSESTTDS